jgi:hypothetical protein
MEEKSWSESDVDNFKYNKDRKIEFLQKLRMPYYKPVIVYVKNKSIPDLKKTLYVVHSYIDLDSFLEIVMNYLTEERQDIKYCFIPEMEEDINCLVGDLLRDELYEEFRNPGDGLLYLILDENKN